jgi:PleD family two-component response regulator
MQTITEQATRRRGTSQPQRVVVVNGNPGLLEMLETVLDAGRYDMTFAETADHAYSSIRQVQPDLVILCMALDEPAGFQLLSMLKLDPETRRIPIVTYASDSLSVENEDEDDDENGLDDFPVTRPAMTMN